MPPSAEPASKPTLLVVTSTLPRWEGDSEPRFVMDLCQAMSPGWRVRVLAPHCAGAARAERWGEVEVRRFRYFAGWGEVLAYEGGVLPRLRARPWLWLLVPWFLLALVASIARELRREPVALIHAHWLLPQGFATRLALWFSRRQVPVICTAHGADVLGLRGAAAGALQRWVARGCARVGVVSEALASELTARGVPQAKLRLMPMGVQVPARAPARGNPAGLVAFAGRLVEKKGFAVLLEAFARVVVEVPQARLCVAGGGPELEAHRRRAASLGLGGCVEFLGAVPHARVLDLFARASVGVMPSVTAADGDSEGLGLVMLEAMAAGCPMIASDLPAVRTVIRDGENGRLVPERDEAALARAILEVLHDPAKAARMAATALQDVARRFSWDAVAANHDRVYSELR